MFQKSSIILGAYEHQELEGHLTSTGLLRLSFTTRLGLGKLKIGRGIEGAGFSGVGSMFILILHDGPSQLRDISMMPMFGSVIAKWFSCPLILCQVAVCGKVL